MRPLVGLPAKGPQQRAVLLIHREHRSDPLQIMNDLFCIRAKPFNSIAACQVSATLKGILNMALQAVTLFMPFGNCIYPACSHY